MTSPQQTQQAAPAQQGSPAGASAAAPPGSGVGTAVLAIGALTAGVTISNVFLAHPLLTVIGGAFHVGEGAAGWVATAALLGYAIGLIMLVPIGDLTDRRRSVALLSVLTAVLLGVAAAAPNLAVLAVVGGLAAATTIVPQIVIPFIVMMSRPNQRGVALAWVQAGLFTGIMGSRIIFGELGGAAGWRASYLLAAGLTLLVALLTWTVLPKDPRPAGAGGGYGALLASLPRLVAEEPVVRWSILVQGAIFGGFNAIWATIVLLLTGPEYGYSAGAASLVGLLGLAGSVAAPIAGRLTDKIGPTRIATFGLFTCVVAVPLWAFGGKVLGLLMVAVLLETIGLQSAHVANQVRVLSRRPAAGSRLNTIYAFTVFLFGAIGAAVGTSLFAWQGWTGVWIAAASFLAFGVLCWVGLTITSRSLAAAAPAAR